MINSPPPITPTAREIAVALVEGSQPCPPLDRITQILKELKGDLDFGTARKLINFALKTYPNDVWLQQQSALCTYKDVDLIPSERFSSALAILEKIGLRDVEQAAKNGIPTNSFPETLALGGAVYKRMFEYDGQIEHLYCSLALYRAAWERDPALDMGYGGGNAAYILDLLASRIDITANRTGTDLEEPRRLRNEAHVLRTQMLKDIPEFARVKDEKNATLGKKVPLHSQQYWYAVTLGEIHFGLKDYANAALWFGRARDLGAKEWERQTMFQQLVSLARMQGHTPPTEGIPVSAWSAAWKALVEFLPNGAEQAIHCWRGKVGLALSGGGFRASLFHLGVLARLAEVDALRSVDVLSTVSGGSIVGAHYYLEVRELLRSKPDASLTREDYIELVKRVQADFLAAVKLNLRTRVLTNLKCNLATLIPGILRRTVYTRSHRMGELYEKHIYSKVKDRYPQGGHPQGGHPQGGHPQGGHPQGGQPRDGARRLEDLTITPAGFETDAVFKPKFQNWRRRSRVPVMLLNSTSLNSGHSWQFTASWMGEPPGLLGEQSDSNARHRRLYYHQAPTPELKHYPLGYAVAASACVPGLFEPLVISGLYPGRTIRLVDGGVQDNQGVRGLLDEACTVIFCSDASGQMDDQPSPSDGMLGVPLRSNAILMSRVREAQYQDLKGRVDNRALQGLFFIHLKQELNPTAIDWVGCNPPSREPARNTATSYGVDREIQEKLSAIRTDLDSFTEVEAYSLMLSGYLMTQRQLEQLNESHMRSGLSGTWGGFDIEAPQGDWRFLALKEIIAKPSNSSDLRRRELGRQLDIGAALVGKAWKISPVLKVGATVIGLLALGGVAYLFKLLWPTTIELGEWKVGGIITTLLATVAVILWPAAKWLNPRKAMRGWVIKALAASLGWLIANFHLKVVDKIFLRYGKLDRLLKLKDE